MLFDLRKENQVLIDFHFMVFTHDIFSLFAIQSLCILQLLMRS